MQIKIVAAALVISFLIAASPAQVDAELAVAVPLPSEESKAEAAEGPDLETTLEWIQNMLNQYCDWNPSDDIRCQVTISGTSFSYVKEGTRESTSRYSSSDTEIVRRTYDFDMINLSNASGSTRHVSIYTRGNDIASYVLGFGDGASRVDVNEQVGSIKLQLSDDEMGHKLAKAFKRAAFLLEGSSSGTAKDRDLF